MLLHEYDTLGYHRCIHIVVLNHDHGCFLVTTIDNIFNYIRSQKLISIRHKISSKISVSQALLADSHPRGRRTKCKISSEGEEHLFPVEDVAGEDPESRPPQVHRQQLGMALYTQNQIFINW